MKIRILAIGKIKKNDLKKLINSYIEKSNFFMNVEIIEIPEYKIDIETPSKIEIALKEECKRIKKHLLNAFNLVLSIEGKKYNSINFSKKLQEIMTNNTTHKNINFIIGGSYGLCENLKKEANLQVSFSDMTLPHQLFRLFVAEQLYRSLTIIKNTKYHK